MTMDTLVDFSLKYLHVRIWIPIWLTISFLALPISSSAKSICLAITVIDILCYRPYREDLLKVISSTWCKATLILFCIGLLACLWSPASVSQLSFSVEKYCKLLYLPVLVLAFQNGTTRLWCLHAFLLALIITCGLSILKHHHYLQAFHFAADNVFRNHIITSFYVSFAAYLCLLFAYSQQGMARLVYALLALMFTYQILFVSGSRTGYIIYLLLMLLLVLQLSTWRQAIAGMGLVCTLFSACYFASPVMQARVGAVIEQIHGYQHHNKNTDLGLRLQFHDYAHKLFNQHPVLGNGTASFTYYFDKEKPIAHWDWGLLEPHSQYWLIAAEFGLLGSAALLYFFISLIQTCCTLDKMKCIAFAMIVPFLIGNLSDSLLFYSGSGYFFIFFMALCLGEWLENQQKLQLKL